MLLKNRLFERKEPSKDAKSIYIFCEGKKREFQYFKYFKEIDSRINILIYELKHNEDNSPTGLLNIAKRSILPTDNKLPKFEFIKGLDEVWLVFDTDNWGCQIEELRSFCKTQKGWSIAQSNPCFEVWLYYHFFEKVPTNSNLEKCKVWKRLVAEKFPGGFDSRKHPLYINKAIANSKSNFLVKGETPVLCSTEVHLLAEKIYSLLRGKIEEAVSKIS